VSTEPAEQIYAMPDAYDLEHGESEADIGFFTALIQRWRPGSLLELACGNGRVTIPLARAAKAWGGCVTGVELSSEMLESARAKPGSDEVTWCEGDLRAWEVPQPYDLIVSPCASMSHLLSLDEQLTAWRRAYANLNPGGRFVVAEVMANLPVLAESMQIPPRVALEIDGDKADESTGQRLIRYRTTRYRAHEQSATVHSIYDRFSDGACNDPERFLSDYDCHVFFPRELQLLFIATGFEIEAIWGDYRFRPPTHVSRQLIVAGRKPSA
jgi:trans-aconitate methyltransferase